MNEPTTNGVLPPFDYSLESVEEVLRKFYMIEAEHLAAQGKLFAQSGYRIVCMEYLPEDTIVVGKKLFDAIQASNG